MAIKSWKDMLEPVSLEEHAGENNVTESVTVQAEKPRPDGANWQVKAYFTNPAGLGTFSGPLPAVHTGFKIYRDGQPWRVIDGGPTPHRAGLGNLRFNGSDEEMRSSVPGIAGLKEFDLEVPNGIDAETFGRRLLQAAQDYDGSLPYSLPTPMSVVDQGSFGAEVTHSFFPAGNEMPAGKFNSNSFAAALLQRSGASPNIGRIQNHLKSNQWSAPGLEQPFSQRYFRNQ